MAKRKKRKLVRKENMRKNKGENKISFIKEGRNYREIWKEQRMKKVRRNERYKRNGGK